MLWFLSFGFFFLSFLFPKPLGWLSMVQYKLWSFLGWVFPPRYTPTCNKPARQARHPADRITITARLLGSLVAPDLEPLCCLLAHPRLWQGLGWLDGFRKWGAVRRGCQCLSTPEAEWRASSSPHLRRWFRDKVGRKLWRREWKDSTKRTKKILMLDRPLSTLSMYLQRATEIDRFNRITASAESVALRIPTWPRWLPLPYRACIRIVPTERE